MTNSKDTNMIEIPKPRFAKGEMVRHSGEVKTIETRIYDLDQDQWLYKFVDRHTYFTENEMISTGLAFH